MAFLDRIHATGNLNSEESARLILESIDSWSKTCSRAIKKIVGWLIKQLRSLLCFVRYGTASKENL